MSRLNNVTGENGFCSATTLPESTALPFVISTEVDADFLPRLLATPTCAALLRESRMQIINVTVSTGNPGERSGEICGAACGSSTLSHPAADLSEINSSTLCQSLD
jgi:hypothetical protein